MFLRVNDMFRKCVCYKIPNKKYVWEFFHVDALQKLVLVLISDVQVEIIVVFILEVLWISMPLEGFTSKLNEDRLKE